MWKGEGELGVLGLGAGQFGEKGAMWARLREGWARERLEERGRADRWVPVRFEGGTDMRGRACGGASVGSCGVADRWCQQGSDGAHAHGSERPPTGGAGR